MSAWPQPRPVPFAPRWLGVTRGVVGVGLVFSVLLVVYVVIQGYLIGTGTGLPMGTTSVTIGALRVAHPVADGWQFASPAQSVDLPVGPLGRRPDLLPVYLAAALPPALLTVTAFAMLLRLVVTDGMGSDRVLFSGETVTRLRRIGWFVLGTSLALVLLRVLTWNVAGARLLPEGIQLAEPAALGAPVTGPGLWLGVVLLGLAEVVQRGRRMREELEGLV